jgi:hypothetical protein
MAELLRIRQTLSPAGYYARNIEKRLGDRNVVINAVICEPGRCDAQIQADRELLSGLPDDAGLDDYDAAREARYGRNES